MSKPLFKKLISPDEARKILYESFRYEPKIEHVSIEECYGRVLAEDIISPIDLPPYTRSLRDGYAVKAEDVAPAREDRPVKLKIVGSVEAGGHFKGSIKSGEAVRVATGAHIPPGANSIVMEEYTKRVDDYVYIYKASSPGEWIQHSGSDVSKGDLIYRRGTFLGPREVGVLAGLGFDKVPVFKRLSVGIISSGNEVVPPGRRLRFGEIYDVNSYSISTLLSEDGCEIHIMGIAKDDFNSIYEMIVEAKDKYDVIVFSGATSVGVKDLLYDVLNSFESFHPLFYGIRIKPGKPTLGALINGKLFIGLPGFPVSGLMVYLHIFSDVIRKVNGLPPRSRHTIEGVSGRVFDSVFGVEHLYPVFLKRRGEKVYFYPIKTDSGAMATLSRSDGFIIIPGDVTYVDKGDKYQVYLFSLYNRPSDLIVYTSHSRVVDTLLHNYVESNEITLKRIFSGSMGALLGVKEGYNDFGTMHLIDESGEYNVTFIKMYEVNNALLYHGFWREIGFVVARGNPHGIREVRDLIEKDVKFINRTLGSGIRTYLDNELKRIASKEGLEFRDLCSRIDGYDTLANTHSAVVSAVEQGLYDVGIVAREAVEGYNVDFIPLHWERVDFLFNSETVDTEPVRGWMEYLSSEEARNILSSVEGIKVDDKYFTKLI